jgi:RNA polymerase sigma-70 factor (ECF subfamily)
MVLRTPHLGEAGESRWINSVSGRPLRYDDQNPRSGDGEKMQRIFQERSGALLRFLRRINSGRPDIVEDLLQETMLRVWRHIGRLPDSDDHIQPWLFTIARNVSADEARKRRRRPQEFRGDYDLRNYPGMTDPMSVVIAADSMLEAYHALSPERQRALEEIYFYRRRAGDAAAILNVPLGTAKSRAFYAMNSVKSAVLSP